MPLHSVDQLVQLGLFDHVGQATFKHSKQMIQSKTGDFVAQKVDNLLFTVDANDWSSFDPEFEVDRNALYSIPSKIFVRSF